ncbi:MAG: GNAT family N-acetyltransferase [Solobacterium sp.]|nr:GNAT family N-acetyltransferase [Solobacterium sp.]
MRIETLNQDQRKQALELAHEAVVSLSGTPVTAIEKFLEEHTARFDMLGAFNEEALTGFIAYEPEGLRIVFIAVNEKYRHTGIGTALCDTLRQKGTKHHLSRLSTNVPSSVKGFFDAYGFEQAGDPVKAGEFSILPMEYLLGREYLGRTVTVTVDRPYGSFHPHNPNVLYSLNFGYVDELISDDGEFVDAWIYGLYEPAETFRGSVIGIIYHKDGPSRFIVGRIGETYRKEDVMDAVAFDEQYYDTRFIWASDIN